MARRKVPDEMWRAANQGGQLDRALERAADRQIERATRISRANGGKAVYRKRIGTRPGGRRYVDVVSDRPDEEAGTEETPRINALRRAARGET